MTLSLIKINFKTNFYEYPASYSADASTFSMSNAVKKQITKYNKELPKNTFIFTDIFPLSASDYPKNDMDFLLLLKSPRDFYDIIMKKKSEYIKRYGKEYKVTKAEIKKYKYKQHNIKYIVERLFKLGKRIYLPGRDKYRPVTLVNYQYEPYNMAFGESKEKFLGKEKNIITVLLELELSEDFKGSVGMDDLKKLNCDQKHKRIGNIWNTLTGKEKKTFKKRNIKYNTPGLYKPTGGAKKKRKRRTRRNIRKRRITKKRYKKK